MIFLMTIAMAADDDACKETRDAYNECAKKENLPVVTSPTGKKKKAAAPVAKKDEIAELRAKIAQIEREMEGLRGGDDLQNEHLNNLNILLGQYEVRLRELEGAVNNPGFVQMGLWGGGGGTPLAGISGEVGAEIGFWDVGVELGGVAGTPQAGGWEVTGRAGRYVGNGVTFGGWGGFRELGLGIDIAGGGASDVFRGYEAGVSLALMPGNLPPGLGVGFDVGAWYPQKWIPLLEVGIIYRF